MELAYRKNDNTQLVRSLAEHECLKLHSVQNYLPIYERFFALSDTTFNSINLDSHYTLSRVLHADTQNLCQAIVSDRSGGVLEKSTFIKFTPWLIKILIPV